MGSPSGRRHGSMAYWPRKRAQKHVAVVNSWKSKAELKTTNVLGFPAYKVGMTNVTLIDNFSHTITKGTKINVPVTILECPPVKVLAVKLLAKDERDNLQVVSEVSVSLKDKFLDRKLDTKKKTGAIPSADELIAVAKEKAVEQVRIIVVTQPSLTTIGKKKSDVLELSASGSIEEQIKFAVSKLGQDVKVSEVFNGGELVDSHGVTKGKGFQGEVKRFGVKLQQHKSEKKIRHTGTRGGLWRVLPTIPVAGGMGYHERTEWNKWILKVSNNLEEINPKAGFDQYGLVKNEFVLVKGSVQGPKKRLVTLVRAARPNKRYPKIAPQITFIRK